MLNSTRLKSIAEKTIKISYFLLFFLTPLTMTTVNYELFEFNKMVLVYLLALIIAFAWGVKLISGEKRKPPKTPLSLPLLLFLLVQALATLFSINPHTSFFGYYTRQNGGLLSFLAYTLLFFALIANFSPQEIFPFIKALLASGFLVASYGVLEHWGIDARYWVQDVRHRVFSTLGQPNWLAAWLDGIIFIPLALAFSLPQNKKGKKFLHLSLFGLFFACLLFTRSRSGFLAFIAGFSLFAISGIFLKQKKKFFRFLIQPLFIIIALTLLIGAPFHLSWKRFSSPIPPPEQVSAQAGGSPSETIRWVVWQGAWALGKKYPLLGTGPETFAYSYYWVRPAAHNLLSEWDFLYNKAHNEYLNFLATSGFLGLGTYLIFIIAVFILSSKIFFSSLKNRPQNPHFFSPSLVAAIISGWSTILITNFFGFSVVTVNLLFFLLPAFLIIFSSPAISSFSPENKKKTIPLLFLTLFFLRGLLALINYWRADYFFSRAEKEKNQQHFIQAQKDYQRAINIRPHEPLYLSHASTLAALLALGYPDEKDQQALIKEAQTLSQEAIKENPYNMNTYRQVAQTFYILSTIAPSYQKEVEKILLAASKLAPTDPKLLYNLGIIKLRQGENQEGINYLKKSIALKPNYELARLELAKIYLEIKDKKAAREELEYLLEKINPQNKEAQELWEKIDKI